MATNKRKVFVPLSTEQRLFICFLHDNNYAEKILNKPNYKKQWFCGKDTCQWQYTLPYIKRVIKDLALHGEYCPFSLTKPDSEVLHDWVYPFLRRIRKRYIEILKNEKNRYIIK